ncbi:MAG: HAMP domain-containing protein [Anaerolineales bacterium]|nr:HAMP domain-containing protein [Anaerolineales bacterium]
MKTRTSLRTNLIIWSVALEAIVLLTFAVLFTLFVQNMQRRTIEETLRLGAVQLNAVVDVRQGDYFAAAAETADMRGRGMMAWVLNPAGELVLTIGEAANIPLPAELPLTEQTLDMFSANELALRLYAMPLSEGAQTLGTIIVAISLAESQAFLRQIALGLVITIPVVLLLSVAGGFILAGRALSPITAITETARQVSAADMTQRLDLALPDDEVGQLAATFNDMLERLERSFRRERQLTADVSHELRTPLGLLKTQLSLARARPRDAATLLGMMADMEGDVDRMTHLVEQLLTLTRLEQREARSAAPVGLDDMLGELVRQLKPLAEGANVVLSLVIPEKLNLTIPGDAASLRRLFSNLIENGLKYTPAGGHVTVTVNRLWQEVTVTIADTGPGIAREHLPHLFERFYRPDEARSRDRGGFGLGLAIARAIVEAHNGRIEVESELGQGTRLIVYLPAGAVTAASEPS